MAFPKNNFRSNLLDHVINWRKDNIDCTDWGCQNKIQYEHILPYSIWKESIFDEFRGSLSEYIIKNDIHHHSGTHNLLSSWILCANLYYPIKIYPSVNNLMLSFLQSHISSKITKIIDVELEFAASQPLDPETLLGEKGGSRGSGQTSPDVCIKVQTESGKGYILIECKYTEHSFYRCSALRTTDRKDKIGNPHPEKCMVNANCIEYPEICHQNEWGRKYWSYLQLSSKGRKILKNCPAAKGGYQLLRQHALANALKCNSNIQFIVSCVAFDSNNSSLIHSMRSSGINNFQTDWEDLFVGDILFKTWTHQHWIEFVRSNNTDPQLEGWLNYISKRYKY